jgi:hypothetical protein
MRFNTLRIAPFRISANTRREDLMLMARLLP